MENTPNARNRRASPSFQGQRIVSEQRERAIITLRFILFFITDCISKCDVRESSWHFRSSLLEHLKCASLFKGKAPISIIPLLTLALRTAAQTSAKESQRLGALVASLPSPLVETNNYNHSNNNSLLWLQLSNCRRRIAAPRLSPLFLRRSFDLFQLRNHS
jgi:hypothetical protein